ncbi:hypothetical protein MBAV_004098, partial [Candidatus Magnetobacterium bavaricum]
GVPVGTIILYPSCQINRGMIFYTYVVANAAGNVPQNRIVGLINHNNTTFPVGVTTYTDASVFGVEPQVWLEKIAVGIST